MVPYKQKSFANEAINLKDQTTSKLVFRKYPWAPWALGTIFQIAAWVVLYCLTLGKAKSGQIFGSRESRVTWWQVLINIGLFLFALVFYYSGKVRTITIDKENGLVSIRVTKMTCQSKLEECEIGGILAVSGT